MRQGFRINDPLDQRGVNQYQELNIDVPSKGFVLHPFLEEFSKFLLNDPGPSRVDFPPDLRSMPLQVRLKERADFGKLLNLRRQLRLLAAQTLLFARKNPPPLGTTITYTYRGLTKTGLPRFPSYLRVREDL